MNIKKYSILLAVVFFTFSITSAASAYSTSTVSAGDGPTRIATLGTNVYVTNASDNTVSVIDTANGNSVTSVAVGISPYVLTILGTKVYVANRGVFAGVNDGSVSIIDTANGNSVTSVSVDRGAQAIFALGTKVYVGFDNIGYVSVIDTANGNSVTNLTISDNPTAGTAAMASVGAKLYVANTNDPLVSIIDTANGNALASTTIGDYASGGMLAVGSKVYVTHYGTSVSVIASNDSVTEVTTGDSPYAFTLVDTTLYVLNSNDDTVSIIDTGSDTLTGSVNVVTLGSEGYLTDLTSLGSKVFVINSLADNVTIIDTANGNTTEVLAVGDNPYVIRSLGSKLYTANNFGDNVTIIETDAAAPSVSLLTPANAAVVSGAAVSLTSSASDDSAIAGVQFKVDGVNIGTEDTTSAYGVTWDSTAVANGTHTIAAVARDAAGNYATSSISVTVTNEVASSPSSSGGGSSSGSSVPKRVKHYYSIGNIAAAESLIKKFPWLFPALVASVSQESASPVSVYTFTQNFKKGETTSGILELQKYLNQHGHPVSATGAGSIGNETSYFGPLTELALSSFQKSHNIMPSVGYFGPLTRAFINTKL